MANGQTKDLAAPHDGSAPGGLLTLAHAIDESPALEESDDSEPLVIPMEDEGVSPLAESMLIEQLLAHSATEVVENEPAAAPADFSEPVSRNEPNPVEAEEFNYVDVAETEAAAGILEPHEVQAETFTVVEPVAETVEPVLETEAQAEIATEPVEFPAEAVAETVEPVSETEALAETFTDVEPVAPVLETEALAESVTEPVESPAEPVAETVEPVSETEAQAEIATEPVEFPAEPVAETVEPVSETETLAETITDAETVEPILETEAQAESVTEPVESPAEPVAETVEPVGETEALAETFTDAEPVAETVEPVSDTEAQAEITNEPVESPAEPVAETVEPVSQTEAPVETITDAEPVAETVEPVSEIEAQAETTTEPVESLAEPVAEIVEPVSESEAPAEIATEPVEFPAEPAAETVEPVSETEAPSETFTDAEPVAETVEPVSETEAQAETSNDAEPVAETVEPAGETEAPARLASLDADDQTDTVEMPAGEFAPDQRAEIEVPEDSALKPAAIAGGVALAGFSTAAILAARRPATPETPAPSVPTSAIPAPPPPVGNRQDLVPAVVVIPPPPGERKVAPAPRRVTIPGWLITVLTAATVLAGFISLWLFFSTTPAQSGSPQTPPRAQNAATASIAPAAPSTLTKYLEVAGLRVTSDSGKKPTLQYVLVNHSAAELSEIKLTITVRSSAATSAQQAPLCVFTVNVPTLTAYESREFKTPIENPVNALELPDWNHLRAEVAVSGQ